MNYKEYKVTPIFYLLEAEKYERAANYIIQEIFKEEIRNIQPNKINDILKKLRTDLSTEYKSIRGEYPGKISIEQMRDIAEKIYQNMCQSLLVRTN
jgi:hypothetical protein